MRGRGQAGSGLGQPPLLRPRIGAKWWAAPGCPGLRPASANQPMAPCWPPTGAVLSTRPRTRSARADALRKGDGLHAPLPRIVISTSAPLLPCPLIWVAGWTLEEAAGGRGGEGTLRATRLFGCATAGAAASARC